VEEGSWKVKGSGPSIEEKQKYLQRVGHKRGSELRCRRKVTASSVPDFAS
jgi:hypothetical protein